MSPQEQKEFQDAIHRLSKMKAQLLIPQKIVIESMLVEKVMLIDNHIHVPEKEFYRFMIHFGATIDMCIEHAMKKVNDLIDSRIAVATNKN